MMMYLLGLGSTSYPLSVETWNAWKRTTFEYDGLRYIGSFAPLFVHQYSQAWFDFRGKRDKFVDYFENSRIATDVHRRFCLELAGQFPSYSDDLWGITASDSQKGYVVWGGPPAMGPIDGTVVPCAAGGSLPFLPQDTMRVLKNIRNKYGPGPGLGMALWTPSTRLITGTTATSSASTPESPCSWLKMPAAGLSGTRS